MGGGGLLLRRDPPGVVAVFLFEDSTIDDEGIHAMDIGRLVGDWLGVVVYIDSVVFE